MSVAVAALGLGVGWYLNTKTLVVLAIYGTMNLGYSIRLKHIVLLDVFIIAAGFLLRVTAGAFAIEVRVSPWLLICTFFIALFLAFCKRRHELVSLGDDAASHRGILAEYSTPFIDKMISALASMTVMSYALVYHRPSGGRQPEHRCTDRNLANRTSRSVSIPLFGSPKAAGWFTH